MICKIFYQKEIYPERVVISCPIDGILYEIIIAKVTSIVIDRSTL
jgi:hypothetical protein